MLPPPSLRTRLWLKTPILPLFFTFIYIGSVFLSPVFRPNPYLRTYAPLGVPVVIKTLKDEINRVGKSFQTRRVRQNTPPISFISNQPSTPTSRRRMNPRHRSSRHVTDVTSPVLGVSSTFVDSTQTIPVLLKRSCSISSLISGDLTTP